MATRTDIEITAADKTAMAFASVNRSLGSLRNAASKISVAFGTLGILSFAKSVIDMGDQLNKTSGKLGISVEDLSAFQQAAKLAGTSSEELTIGIARLGKNVSEAITDPTSEAATALRNLGYSTKDLKDNSLGKIFEGLAPKISGIGNETARLQYEITLFGKSGYQLQPLLASLDDVVGGIRKTNGVMSKEFAEASERFNDELTRMSNSMTIFISSSSSGTSIVDSLLTVLKSVQFVALGVAQGFEELGTSIGALASAGVAAAKLDFKEAKTIMKLLSDDLLEIQKKGEAARAALFAAPEPKVETTEKPKPIDPPFISNKGYLKELENQKEKVANFLQQIKKQAAEAGADISDDERKKALDRIQISKDEWLQKASVLRLSLDDQRKFIAEFNNWSENTTALALKKTATPIEQLSEQWKNTTKELQDAGAGWLEDMSSKLTEFVMTGKLNFKDFAKSIIADLVRIKIQKTLAGIFGGSTGTNLVKSIGAIAGLRANGGPVSAGKPYIVGERGPELMVPSMSGTIIPNDAMSGSSVVVNQTIQIQTGVQQTVRAEIMTLLPQIKESTIRAVAEERRRGGALATAFG